jgi:hypothetical protein
MARRMPGTLLDRSPCAVMPCHCAFWFGIHEQKRRVASEDFMTLFSGIRSINTLILILVLVGSGVARAGNDKSLRQAVVSADMLKAFAEANARSNVVRLLAKGEVVSIILKVSTSGEDWCRVVLQEPE